MFYMKNDMGQWVEVVSLIESGRDLFFRAPPYGGIMVIDQGKHNFKDYMERITIGKGTYIPPSEIQNHPFWCGKIPCRKDFATASTIAQFLAGFTDPLPWNKETAVKIPDLKDDENWQPLVTDFDFSGMGLDAYDGLYHWFGLEPIGDERTSLSFSVMILPMEPTNCITTTMA